MNIEAKTGQRKGKVYVLLITKIDNLFNLLYSKNKQLCAWIFHIK